MSINTIDLQNERDVLVKDFDALKDRIKQVDAELIQMKSNLSAMSGAIQVIDRLINKTKSVLIRRIFIVIPEAQILRFNFCSLNETTIKPAMQVTIQINRTSHNSNQFFFLNKSVRV